MKVTSISPATSDQRGNISDILYKSDIEHVSMVNTVGGETIIRGNHYHKETTQYMFLTKGELFYVFKNVDDNDEPEVKRIKQYDLVETPPNEIHALLILEETQFMVFTKGKRGGQDYESDTFRVDPILTEGLAKTLKEVFY